jgi:Mg-chelatase subunit ChlD
MYGVSVEGTAPSSTPTPVPTSTPEPSPTPTPSPTAQPTATIAPTATAEPTATATPALTEPGALRVVAPAPVTGAESAPLAGDVSVALIVDTSGSMLQPLGESSRADVAKSALIDLVTDTLPPGTGVSLRAFGVVPDSCDSRLVVPRQPLDPSAMAAKLQDLEVVNLVKTPLGDSLAAVAGDLGAAPGPKIVVLVTDGEETCGGDPPAAIAALVATGIDVRVNIVGFALDDDTLRRQFQEWARLGNGQYIDAVDATELDAAIAQAVQPLYNVIDSQGNIVASGQVGGPALSLPAGIYRVEVLTQPTLIYEVVRITAGQEMQLVIG